MFRIFVLLFSLAVLFNFVGCDGPKAFPLTSFTVHEVRDAASTETMAKSFQGETLHLIKVPLMSEPLATSISVENAKAGPVVYLTLADERTLHKVTEMMLGKRLALLVQGRPVTAPVVREPITGGSIALTGNFTLEEAEKMVATLKSGE